MKAASLAFAKVAQLTTPRANSPQSQGKRERGDARAKQLWYVYRPVLSFHVLSVCPASTPRLAQLHIASRLISTLLHSCGTSKLV